MKKLEGKVAIVTGAGAGLGKAYAKEMAKEGASIVVNDVVADTANNVVAEIKSAGGKAAVCIGGVGTKEVADKLVDTAVKEFGKVDILVNNAGITRDAMLHKMTEEQWDAIMYVHLRGAFLNTQAAVKYMIENKIKGRIINATSQAGIYGNVGQANYSTAKAGLIGFTKALSRELVRRGICVNAIAPQARTPMTEAIPDQIKQAMFDKMAQDSVIQRMGEPEDVCPLLIFLASDDSYFITGQIICATGSVGVL